LFARWQLLRLCTDNGNVSTYLLGRAAEQTACDLLRQAGLEIVARNYRCSRGEIDIVAVDDGELVFVEVRSRASQVAGTAADTIDWKKRQTLTSVAGHFLERSRRTFASARFDVICFTDGRYEWLKHAFEPEPNRARSAWRRDWRR
jgi:putative endonuclease